MSPRVLVCGASSGIGRAIAIQFAQKGYQVFALARRVSLLEELVEYGITPIVADLDELEEALEEVQKIRPVHILINNTGGPSSGRLLDAPCSDLQHAFSRHVLAAHSFVQALVPDMMENGMGRIINIISTSVYEPIPNLGVSNTIRAAMAGWAKSLSQELPSGITINNVLPGYTDTERLGQLKAKQAERKSLREEEIHEQWLAQVPEGRLASADEIAHAVLFLASSEASYIRGISLAVDGGRLRSI